MVRRANAELSAIRKNFISVVFVVVLAIAFGCLVAVNAGAAKPALPKQVGSLKVRASSGTLALTWKAPVNAKRVPVTGYAITYRKSSSKRWTKLKTLSRKKTSYRLTGLKNGVAYKLRIAARSQAGLGAVRTVTAIPRKRGVGGLGSGPTLTAPGQPQSFSIAAGMGRISADWNPPAVDGGSKLTRYELRFHVAPDGDWSTVSTPANEPGTTVSGLIPQVLYELSVRAVNAVGAGAWTPPLSTEPLPLMAVPSEPLNLTATGGLNTITLDWDPPASEGDAPVGLYEVRGRTVGSPTWSSTVVVDAPATTYVIDAVDDLEYEWTVRAVNAGGHGDWSDGAFASAAVAPKPPVNVVATRGDGTVDVSWNRGASGGTPTSYTVHARVAGTSSWTISQSTVDDSAAVAGLTNGTPYEFAVQASNAAGHSLYSVLASATPAGLPGAPQTLVLAPGDETLAANWSAPANTGGLPVTYSIRHKLSSSGTWTDDGTVTGTSTVIGGLVNGSVYDVSVRAVNAVGAGGWSATVSGKPATVPDAPAPLELTAGDTLVNAVWQAPADNGGAAVSGYETRIREDGGAWGPASATSMASRSFTGLSNGVDYEIAVRALNELGAGPWTSEHATPQEAGVDVPGEPTALSPRLSTTNDAVALTWLAPATGGAPTGYEVRTCSQTVAGLCSGAQVLSASATSASITNSLTGQYVRAQLRALGTGGNSAWVQSATIYSPHLTLPVMRIDTTGSAPIVSKETYIGATYTLDANGSPAVANVSTPAVTEIRGRGNSTWNAPKKPYKIKLDKSTALLTGVTKSKHWALLANYYDPSALRTAIAMDLGRQTGLAWTPASEFVEVVLNGNYVGMYQLIETVRVDPASVNDPPPDPAEPGDLTEPNVTGGYTLEIDGRLDGPETNTFTTPKGADVVIQDPENAAPEQKSYVVNYVKSFEAALYGSNYADPAVGWRKYMDEPSLIDWYLVNEFFANNDAMYSSTDLYKPRGGKLMWGPLWDFDISIGRGWGTHPPDAWWVRTGGVFGTMAPWMTRLFQEPGVDGFAAHVKARWQQLAPVFANAATYAGSIAPALATAAAQSESIWPKLSVAEQGAETSFSAATPVVQSWLSQRYAWMNAAAQYGG